MSRSDMVWRYIWYLSIKIQFLEISNVLFGRQPREFLYKNKPLSSWEIFTWIDDVDHYLKKFIFYYSNLTMKSAKKHQIFRC